MDPANVKRSGDDVKQVVEEAVLPAAPSTSSSRRRRRGHRRGASGRARRGPQPPVPGRDPLAPRRPHRRRLLRPRARGEWTWTGWLPHVRRLGDGSGGQWLSTERARSESMLRAVRDGIESFRRPRSCWCSTPTSSPRAATPRALAARPRPAARPGLRRRQAPDPGLGHRHRRDGRAAPGGLHDRDRGGPRRQRHVSRPLDRVRIPDVVLAGVSVDTARSCAADLARFDDPELSIPARRCPARAAAALLGIDEVNAAAIRRSWSSSTRIDTPLGVGEDGVFGIDLVRDGPRAGRRDDRLGQERVPALDGRRSRARNDRRG